MNRFEVKRTDITKLNVDAIVNIANEELVEKSGVCSTIFREAGSDELSAACQEIAHCDVGDAVITPGFKLKAKYIIHAVGPAWHDGYHHESKLLYDTYKAALTIARDNDCHSIAFPLLPTDDYWYPKDKAWKKAFEACGDFMSENRNYKIRIIFSVRDDSIEELLRMAKKYGRGYR